MKMTLELFWTSILVMVVVLILVIAGVVILTKE